MQRGENIIGKSVMSGYSLLLAVVFLLLAGWLTGLPAVGASHNSTINGTAKLSNGAESPNSSLANGGQYTLCL